jgi:uncharacterized ion transporter superfamily protein YfcC
MALEEKSRFSIKVPHTLVLLFIMMVLAQISTYILPQGAYETFTDDAGHTTVVPETYQTYEEKVLLPPWHILMVVPRAFADTQAIIFFVFIIGGALAVIKATGTVDAALGKVLEKFGSRPWLLILVGMLSFSIGSGTLGMAEEYLPFVAVLIALCLAMGLDKVTAIGIMVVGYGIGYGVAAFNPFTVIVAQNIAGLSPTSGMGYRLALLVPFFLVGYFHVLGHARKNSAMTFLEKPEGAQYEKTYPALKKSHITILLLTVLAIAVIVYGISDLSGWGWYLTELGAVFLGLGIISAIIGKVSTNTTAIEFSKGATELTTTALLIGFARAIALILEDGQVLHTIVHGLATPLQQTGPMFAAMGMFWIQTIINLFIPSGSGQAFVTMPLMVPIADLTEVSRQTAVLAYQFGDGFANMIVPTNAVLMGIIGIAGIPYDKWFKFIFPLMIKVWILGSVAMALAVWIGYQ